MYISTRDLSVVLGFDQDLLACPLHDHGYKGTFYRWCVVAYLRSCTLPGTDAAAWVSTVFKGRDMWTEVHARKQSGLTAVQLQTAAAEGRVKSILNPGDKYVYDPVTVLREMRRLA